MDRSTMREDLQLSLRRSGIDPANLRDFQRVLLTTDGTVTDMLEAYYREPMAVEVLAQQQSPSPVAYRDLRIAEGHDILDREILLRGRLSGSVMLYARSQVAIDRLPEAIHRGLLEQRQPLGVLMLHERLETYREIIDCHREKAGALAAHFQIHDIAPLLSRTYVISHAGQPIIRVTEKFPEWGR